MDALLPLLYVLVGLGIGVVATLLVFRSRKDITRQSVQSEFQASLAVLEERVRTSENARQTADQQLAARVSELGELQKHCTGQQTELAKYQQAFQNAKQQFQQQATDIKAIKDASTTAQRRIDEQNGQITSLSSDLAQARQAVESEREQSAIRLTQITLNNQSIKQLQDINTALERKLAQCTETLEQEQKQSQEKLALLEDAQAKLLDSFRALAAEALKSNNQSFLALAKENLQTFQTEAKGDLEQRQAAIDKLVTPVKESLDKVDVKIQELEKARVGAYSGLTQQVTSLIDMQKDLRTETSNLVRALRSPTARGRWGEIQLKRVVELAGMLNYCDFEEQHHAVSGDGRIRPDLLIRLPGAKNIIVDSKAPLAAYLDAIDATDDETKRSKLADHARQVRNHASALGKKAYQEQIDSAPEFVVLFLPGEIFFSAALEHDPTLVEYAFEHKVIIASPTTLIALLRAVAHGWSHENLAENAKAISELGRELYKRCFDMGEHLEALGKNLRKATDSYNKTVGSMEHRVLVTARKFATLGIGNGESQLAELEPIESIPRSLQAAELLGQSESAGN
ncbi:MAG: DNA recombination protein RmuC [Planctomycetota bacterium]|nr:DNA recombination protein RmuC [Planctomycetota bacterium]